MKLAICIPTVVGREEKFSRLYDFINEQIIHYQLQRQVKILIEKDNKEISIGNKRQSLYEKALLNNCEYSVQIDDDDWLAFDFVKQVYEATKTGADCIGYIESCNINGNNIGNSLFSKNFPDWIEKLNPPVQIGEHTCVRVRTPFFKTPIKTDLCIETGVKDMRFGEDHDFSRRILPLLKTEAFIEDVMYMYGYVSEGTHNERYGITR